MISSKRKNPVVIFAKGLTLTFQSGQWAEGSKPCFILQGEEFEQKPEFKKFANIMIGKFPLLFFFLLERFFNAKPVCRFLPRHHRGLDQSCWP